MLASAESLAGKPREGRFGRGGRQGRTSHFFPARVYDRVRVLETVWFPFGGRRTTSAMGVLLFWRNLESKEANDGLEQSMAGTDEPKSYRKNSPRAERARDLTQLRLSPMEAEVYQAVDRVTGRVLQGLLAGQVAQSPADCCACCQGPLESRPPRDEPIQLARCQVQWEQPVQRCRPCRRDFFPSGDPTGLPGGSDL